MQDRSLIEPEIAGTRKAAMAFIYVTIILGAALLMASLVVSIRVAQEAREQAAANGQSSPGETQGPSPES